MADPNARERAAARLVEVLTPAAALGIACTYCDAEPGRGCVKEQLTGTPMTGYHSIRIAAARAELHQLLLTLGLG